jgi:peptidoglycan-N-acetylglucosamine deacetylase
MAQIRTVRRSPGSAAAAAVAGVAGAAAVGAAGLAVAHAGPGVTALGPVRRTLFPRLSGRGSPDHVALTFDDGPDAAATPQVLETLAARRMHATFFLLGCMVERDPRLAAEVTAAGHEVGVHGLVHDYLLLRGPRATRDDISRARDVISEATGCAPRWFRPPYGVLTWSALATVGELGLAPVLWTDWGREWVPGSTPASVYATLTAGLRGGATVLLHDSDCTSPPGSARSALGALPMLLDECERRELRVGPLGDHGIGFDGRRNRH